MARTEITAARRETSKTFRNDDGSSTLEAHCAPIHYKEDYQNPSESWKDIDLKHVVEHPAYFEYDRLPSIVRVLKDRLGYEMISRQTGHRYLVELDRMGNREAQKRAIALEFQEEDGFLKPNVRDFQGLPVDFEFQVMAFQVRLWKNLKTDKAPRNFRWRITEDNHSEGLGSLRFKEKPEALDEDGKPVEVQTGKTKLDDRSFLWEETAAKEASRIDTDVSYYSGAGDGWIKNHGSWNDWDSIHDASSGSDLDYTSQYVTIDTRESGTGLWIVRAFFPIDTSQLPDSAQITSASFVLRYSSGSDIGDDWQAGVVQTSQASTSQLSLSDYDQCGAVNNPTEGAPRVGVGSYLTFNLNATGRSWISKTGYTKLGVRTLLDLDDIDPDDPDSREGAVNVSSSETSGTIYDPKLTVTYTLSVSTSPSAQCVTTTQLSPTVIAVKNAMSAPSAQTATLSQPSPTVSTEQNVTISPAALSLTASQPSPTIITYSGEGSGTQEDPFLITSWAQLAEVNDYPFAYWKLTADLDENSTGYDTYASSSANSGQGWLPIGDNTSPFTGGFDGNGHTISGLYINRDSDYQGLFGKLSGATVISLGLVDCAITSANDSIGALVGTSNNSTITNCYATGTVSGGDYNVGGLVGYHSGGSTMSGCYAVVSVSGSYDFVGGLVGYNDGSTITNCYATGSVAGTHYYTGGLVGRTNDGQITKCYSTGKVTTVGGNFYGGFCGYVISSTTQDNFWDTQTSEQATSAGATGKTTAEMKDIDTYTNLATEGLTEAWDMVNVAAYIDETWYIDDSYSYPKLGWEPLLVEPTVLVSPTDTSSGDPTAYFVWEIPNFITGRNISFQLQIDRTDNTFGDIEVAKDSREDNGFQYWDGADWQSFGEEGVSNAYIGNQARIQITLPTEGIKYWRVRGYS
ncbi:MAG: GLUG motif-containing protein [Dehalococcoidales bacterium]|nr:GLUG motif-containing protein [Dehalococcoidales bacterium]